jgi:antitoxin component YwqK of YwqJK toxin-antitoxin module
MLKPYFTFLLLLMTTISIAQVNKIYITENGLKTQDPFRAKFYILSQKLPNDSAWYTRVYDMMDVLMVTGTYKNEELTIQHGMFTFYKLQKPNESILYKYNILLHHMDTISTKAQNFVFKKGFFINGAKTGKWLEYNSKNELIRSFSYVNDKLDGPSKEYYWGVGNKVFTDGNYVNNKKEGLWYIYNEEQDTLSKLYFHGGVFARSSPYKLPKRTYTNGKPSYSLVRYLNFALATTKFKKGTDYEAFYRFKLTKEGKLTEPEIYIASNIYIDEAIIGKLLDGPDWVPATIDGKTSEEQIALNIKIEINEHGRAKVSYLTDKGCKSY